MEQWLRRHHTDMPTLTARSAEAAAPLAAGDMTAETIELSGKLMTDLAMKTTGKAKRLLMALEDQSNGFEVLRQLALMGQGSGRNRKTGALIQALHMKFDPKDFVGSLLVFEDIVRQYKRSLTGGATLDDDAKMVTLVNSASGELKNS